MEYQVTEHFTTRLRARARVSCCGLPAWHQRAIHRRATLLRRSAAQTPDLPPNQQISLQVRERSYSSQHIRWHKPMLGRLTAGGRPEPKRNLDCTRSAWPVIKKKLDRHCGRAELPLRMILRVGVPLLARFARHSAFVVAIIFRAGSDESAPGMSQSYIFHDRRLHAE